ncbi:alginate O-acetyltransferase AlgX-related protein [Microbacterium terregens]|uniref:AlgX/AlgJ SGNH hydrolase-like domain-containing protein n=1 Tax=Microbacterium terregens TaxID=69363 RepID=A0ABV5SZL5_9MICO
MSLTELPPGQEKVAGPRWWTRVSYIGLVILGVISTLALVLGFVANVRLGAEQGERDSPAAVEAAGPIDAICRPPVAPATQEPWISGDGSAEATWQEHAEEIGERYVIGPNGWIFWSDYVEQYASQAVGRAFLTTGQVQNWVDYYNDLREQIEAQGIEFYIAVTPSTSSIYPEELPEWMQGLRGSTIMDQFVAAAGDLPLIDMRQPLIDAKPNSEFHSFSWSNSHWTEYGGYLGWSHIAPCVNEMFPDDPPLQVPTITGVEVTGDFNEWAPFGVKSNGPDWAVPIFADAFQDVTISDKDGAKAVVSGTAMTDASILPVTTEVSESWTGKSALIVRDSMGGALSPYWQQAYSPTWQEWHQYGTFDVFPDYRQLVEQHKPDVVVVQFAERHLIQVPPPGAGY